MSYIFLSGFGDQPKNVAKATIDFETRSAADLLKVGAWKYSQHHTTEVLCLYVRLPHWDKARGWHKAYPHLGIEEEGQEVLEALFEWIREGKLVEAHNSFFERSIWENVCVPKMDFPEILHGQWRCSAAKACVHSLPRALGTACQALNLPVQKDGAGRRVMLKMCKPRKPRKAEKEEFKRQGLEPEEYPILWHEDPDDLQILWDYCGTDVDSEHGLSESLPDLSPQEQEIWQMDQDMNHRGIQSDVEMAKVALRLIEKLFVQMNAELEAITGGACTKGSQRQAIRKWLGENGVDIPDTTGPTVDEWLDNKTFKKQKPGCHRVMRILREVNRTSTAKFKTCLAMASEVDGRLRDQMMYHGANTGRWAGKGLQPHNFPRGDVKDMELACRVLMTEDLKLIESLFDEPIKLMSDVLRGLLIPSEGRDFVVADYSAIEARVVTWLAHETDALEVFRTGKCIYMDMATSIYGYTVNDKVAQFAERQMGKQAILGLGFGMGFVTFLLTCHKYNIRFSKQQAKKIVGGRYQELLDYMEGYFFPERKEDADKSAKRTGRMRRRRLEKNDLVLKEIIHELVLMKHIVDVYRAKYSGVAAMWNEVEEAAVRAVTEGLAAQALEEEPPLIESKLGRCSFRVEGRFLKCYLPSGRPLYYCDPNIRMDKTPWGDKKATVVFMGVNSMTKKWERQSTYGGKLVENITQATARDLMAEAMVAAHEHPTYDVLLSVHDELIAEVDKDAGSVEEFEALMSKTPAWAGDCPVAAEGWRGTRYRK